MKLFKAIGKNLKILFRKKSSLLTIILGPLLVILVLGLAFSSTSNIKISVGYIAPDESPLTLDFIDSLSQNYLVKEFIYKESCVRDLEQGILHACIVFPADLNIENNKTNNISFIVDKSRISMAYSVIESITKDIDIKTNELSKDLTEVILNTLISTDDEIDETLSLIVAMKSLTSEGVENSDEILEKFGDMVENIDSSGIDDLTDDIEQLHDYTVDIYNKVSSKTDNSIDLIDDISGVDQTTQDSLDEIEEDLESMDETASDKKGNSSDDLEVIIDFLDEVSNNLNAIESSVGDSESLTKEQKESLNILKSNIDEIKSKLIKMQNNIRNIEITSASNIVSPINTQIETISAEKNRLALILPYAIMLVIMFSALLLASTLIVLEKRSKASFRTFTTPTKDEFFILANYLTSFLIVFAQIAIILAVVDYFVVNIILSNIWVNLVLLLLSISLFIMVGMMIGYLLKTQQATNMATISIGAIFLFVSNIIFPLESIAPSIQRIADFNPFVLTSEVMRKSLLFNIGFDKIMTELFLLLGYSVLFLILIMIFQRLSKTKYFNNLSFLRSKVNRFTKEFIELNDERIINKEELVDELKKMDDDTYKLYMSKNYKEFKTFLRDVLEQKKLGNLKKISKDKLIDKLEKRIEKRKKRLEKNNEKDRLIDNITKEESEKEDFDENSKDQEK